MKEISSILYESLFYHVQKYNKYSFKPFIVQIILWLDFAFPIKEKDILYQWIMFDMCVQLFHCNETNYSNPTPHLQNVMKIKEARPTT